MSEFILGQGLGHELELAIGRTGGLTSDVQWLRTGCNFESVILLAREKAQLVQCEVSPATEVDPIVRVDRSIRPVYPDFLNQEYVNTSEFITLENMGPGEFDASRLRKWWHPQQKKKGVGGTIIHNRLLQKKLLPSCLGFADLLGIQARGRAFFLQHFKGQAVFGWRSVVPDRHGGFGVPFLVEGGGKVVLNWNWLNNDFDATNPALRFATLLVSSFPCQSSALAGFSFNTDVSN